MFYQPNNTEIAATLCQFYAEARANRPLTEYEALLYESAANVLAVYFRKLADQIDSPTETE